MDDDTWNKLAHSIRPEISTGNEKVDEFFRTVFEPYTGSWITKHPELDKLNELHLRLQKDMSQRE